MPNAPRAAGDQPVQPKPQDPPVTFRTVFEKEMQQIANARQAREVHSSIPTADNLIGLAFSGGGIRSATFNLGILQALAEKGLLHKFDYLSTVSGGGYIGSWLAAVIHRFLHTVPNSTFRDVEQALIPVKRQLNGREERTFLRWLRLYSNYLTPHTGLVSGDTWERISTWLRNVFLRETVLILFVSGVFMFCDGALLGLMQSYHYALALLIVGGVLWFVALVSVAWNTAQIPSRQMLQTTFQQVRVTVTVILPFFLSCLLLNFGLWHWAELADSPLWMWFAAGGWFYFLAWVVATVPLWLWRRAGKKTSAQDRMIAVSGFLPASLIAGAVGGGLVRGYLTLLEFLPRCYAAYWIVTVFGTGAMMLIVLVAGAVHSGLAGRGCRDLVREWWARLGGYMMLLTMAWISLGGSCTIGPLLVRWVWFKLRWESIVPAVFWLLLVTLATVFASKKGHTGNESMPPLVVRLQRFWIDLQNLDGDWKTVLFVKIPQKLLSLFSPQELFGVIAWVGPYIYAIGLFLFVATAVHIVLGMFSGLRARNGEPMAFE